MVYLATDFLFLMKMFLSVDKKNAMEIKSVGDSITFSLLVCNPPVLLTKKTETKFHSKGILFTQVTELG